MYSVELYRDCSERARRAGPSAAASGWPPAPSGWPRSAARSAGRARSGCRCEEISVAEAVELFPLMDPDGRRRRGRTCHRRPDRPLPALLRAGRRARAGGVRDPYQHTRVLGIDVDRRPGDAGPHRPGRHRVRGRGQLRRHVRRRDRPDGRHADPDRADVAPVRRHRARFHERRTGAADACATPTCSSTTGRRSTGLVMGGYERTRAPWTAGQTTLRRHPGRLQRPPARRGLGPVRGDRRESRDPGAGHGRRRHPQADQRAGGVHPGQRVLPGRDRGRTGSSSRPGSARTASPARAASAG